MPKNSIHTARFIVLLACLPLIASCMNNTSTASPELEDINYDIETVYTSIDALRKRLDEQYTEICKEQQTKLVKENSGILKDNTRIKRKLKKSKEAYAELEKRCETRNVIGKLLVGEIENVRLIDENMEFSARIDTGADTSSIGVFNLQDFERDGKTWVKFKLVNKKSAPTYEYRVNGRVRIKQNAKTEGDERFEIKMNIGIGNKDYPRQVFNLSDRSYLEHQVLIGRSFLTDVAIVDTSSKYRLNN